ncbi:nitrite reductase small subunit NirD [Cumulibacter manganitolerans]|uniref:nitrite reductase small subunit NirD n=1 Tax=Cumulibacter manganitolerans TaxID=1884992 RepID=UPI001297EF45|nr:nitrite reductase small subunit NirD [Cumulibacter manganitolerans]
MSAPHAWQAVCRADQLPLERGVAALVDGVQIALVRTADGTVYAVGHRDPYSGANVIARGIVGSRIVDDAEVPTIASPMYKQVFDLRDGRCLAEPEVSLGSWPVRVVRGAVEVRVGARPTRRSDA